MSCEVPEIEVCFYTDVNDAIVWSIPDATPDPLGYDFNVGTITKTATVANGMALQDGDNVIVTVPILIGEFEKGNYKASIVSNTKNAGVYEAIKLRLVFSTSI